MIKEAISKVINNENLSFEETESVMNEIMTGNATNAQIASFLTALRIKGETTEEITACATVMRKVGVHLGHNGDVLEIVGTGGDEAFTFNISSVSSIVTAAAGVPTAKHGNRSVSSKCGAADVFEELGVKLNITPQQNEKVLADTGLCFMFAPVYHSSMKYAAPVRKEMGIRTIFNILGPLANPASATIQLMGVYSEDLVEPMAQVLKNLGVKHGMVVYGQDGIDEVSLVAKTTACEINNDEIKKFEINPEDYGMGLCKNEDLTGGDTKKNAQIALNVLKGEKSAKRDVVLLNSGIALYIAGKADSIAQGIDFARETIDSGKAMEQLDRFIKATNEVC